MTLGDLAFTPEDAAAVLRTVYDLNPEAVRLHAIAAEQLNELLRERLGKAPEVQANWKVGKYDWCEINRVGDTHRARLVCIEEMKP